MNTMAAAVLVWGCLAVTASAQQPSAKGLNYYSLERERELGRSAAVNLERALPIVHEPALDAYIAQLGGTLAKNVNSAFSYTFTVYEDRRPGLARPAGAGAAMPMDAFQGQAGEPVAVAGGPIFIPLSLLAGAPNEAVFAFQMSHAMAHIALRHVTKQATRTELMRSQDPPAIPLGALQFSRAFEREADYVALRMVSQAGYSPEPIAAYLSGQPSLEKSAAVFSAHPASGERAKAIRVEFKKLPAATYVENTGGFAEAKAMAAGIR